MCAQTLGRPADTLQWDQRGRLLVFFNIDKVGNVAMDYGCEDCLGLQDPIVHARMQRLRKEKHNLDNIKAATVAASVMLPAKYGDNCSDA